MFKVVKHLDTIVSMNSLTNPDYILCTEEWLTTLKNIRDQNITLMNKKKDMYWACWHKTNFH